MARYRKVDTRIWNDERFMALSDDGKLAFFFVMTNPHMTALGAMRGTIPGLAAEIGWRLSRFSRAFGEVVSKGMAEIDERAAFIALPNFLKYNPPESPNVVRSWGDSLDLLPECDGKRRLSSRARASAASISDAFANALPEVFVEALSKGMPNQEQEQEQEQESDRSEDRPAAVPAAPRQLTHQQHLVKGIEDFFKRRDLKSPRPGTIAQWLSLMGDPADLHGLLVDLEGNGKLFGLGDGLEPYVFGCIKGRLREGAA